MCRSRDVKKKAWPRIKKHFSIIAHTPNEIELRSGVWNPIAFTVKDQSNSGQLFQIFKGLDGTLSPAELATQLNIPLTDITEVIEHLQELGTIETTATNALEYYLEQVDPLMGTSMLEKKAESQTPILLLGDPELTKDLQRLLTASLGEKQATIVDSSDPLFLLLKEADDSWLYNGLKLQEKLIEFQSWKDHFIILALHSIDPLLSYKLNRIAYGLNISWMHSAIDGPFLFAGPLFIGKQGPCYECFETRVMMNLKEQASYQRYKQALVEKKNLRHAAPPIEPVLRNLLASHVALETLNYILTNNAFTIRKVLSIYLPTMEIMFHDLLRVAGCQTCGAIPQRDGQEHCFDSQALLSTEEV